MNGAGDQFLSRPGLAINQNRRIRWRHGFHSLEGLTDRCAISDNLSEIHFRADFIFQIEFFLRELLFQFPNLAVGERILGGESNLVCNLAKEPDIGLTERIVSEPGENQGANRAIPADQRQKTEGLQTFANRGLNDWVMEPTGEGALEGQGLHRSKYRAGRRSLDRINQVFLQEPFSLRKVNRVKSQLLVVRVRERQAGVVALHHAADVLRDGPQQITELQVRDNLIGDVKEQLQPVVLTL